MLCWKAIVSAVSGAFDTELARQVDFLKAENRTLRRQLRGRPRLTDEERRTLALLARPLRRKILAEISTVVTPDTLCAWYRRLVAGELEGRAKRRRTGRPPTAEEITELVLQLARENPGWGYTRIRDALKQLGHTVSRSTVASILKQAGIEPTPHRPGTTWKDFLAAHRDVLLATDFFSQKVLTPLGFVTCYVLFFIHVGTRRVHIAGVTRNPDGLFMERIAREATSADGGFLPAGSVLLHDRDKKYTREFAEILAGAGVECVKLPRRSPNLNAFAERWIQSVRGECLDRLILLGERPLRHALEQYVEHYNRERPHQGLDGRLVDGPGGGSPASPRGEVRCRKRLGGLLKYYYREAA